MRIKKCISWLLIIVLPALYACNPPSASTASEAEQERFEAFLQSEFVESVTDSAFNLHFTLKEPELYGIDISQITTGELEPEDLREVYREDMADAKELLGFDRALLTPEQQHEYDVLTAYDESLPDEEFLLYGNPMIIGGNVNEIPILLSQFAIDDEQDVKNYLLYLRDIPRLLGEAGMLLEEQSRIGLFMPDYAADTVIGQIEGFINPDEENIMVFTFDQRLNQVTGLTEEQRKKYQQENRTAIFEAVIPAYQTLIDVIESLKGTGTNEMGICYYPDGAQFYEQLIRWQTGLEESVTEIERNLMAEMDVTMGELTDLMTANPGLLEREWIINFGETDALTLLTDLEEKIAAEFPALEDVNYTVDFIPAELEFLATAFYFIPPIDTATENVIQVQQNISDPFYYYSLLAHEGFPGHLYQYNYSLDISSPLRLSRNFMGYNEGWATYVELLSYDMADLSDSSEPGRSDSVDAYKRMNQLDLKVNLFIYALLDIGINYHGWTEEQAMDNLGEHVNYDIESMRQVYESVTQNPGIYLVYGATAFKIESLRTKAEDALGGSFDAGEFHRAILDLGPCRYGHVEKAVDNYILSHS